MAYYLIGLTVSKEPQHTKQLSSSQWDLLALAFPRPIRTPVCTNVTCKCHMTITHEYHLAANMSASEACTSAAVPASATVLCSWPVEKYARFVPTLHPLPTREHETRKSNSAGSWQVGARLNSISNAIRRILWYYVYSLDWSDINLWAWRWRFAFVRLRWVRLYLDYMVWHELSHESTTV